MDGVDEANSSHEMYSIQYIHNPFVYVCAYACVCAQSQDGRMDVRGRHGKSMLTISGVKLTDLGRFDCEALSRIGGHQKSMFLDIECKYSLRTKTHMLTQIQYTHKSSHICTVYKQREWCTAATSLFNQGA